MHLYATSTTDIERPIFQLEDPQLIIWDPIFMPTINNSIEKPNFHATDPQLILWGPLFMPQTHSRYLGTHNWDNQFSYHRSTTDIGRPIIAIDPQLILRDSVFKSQTHKWYWDAKIECLRTTTDIERPTFHATDPQMILKKTTVHVITPLLMPKNHSWHLETTFYAKYLQEILRKPLFMPQTHNW